jgi:membrane protein required for colicin V production
LSWVDLIIVAVIAWFTFRAYSNGLIREVVTLGAVIIGAILAGLFYDNLADNLDFLIESQTTRRLISFAAIFIGIVVAGHLLAAILKTTAALLLLGPIDHIGGAVFGFIKGLILVQVALIAFAVFPAIETVSRSVDDSRLAPFFLETLPFAGFGLPSEFDLPLDQLDEWRRTLGAIRGASGDG